MKHITYADDTLKIRNSFWKLKVPKDSIQELNLYTSKAYLTLTLKQDAPVSVSPLPSLAFMAAWSEGKLQYYGKEKTLLISLYPKSAMKADEYYEGVEQLKRDLPGVNVHETGLYGPEVTIVLNTVSNNAFTCPCYKCGTEFSYTINTQYPYLVKCPSCGTLNYNAECFACGLGGFVVPKEYFKPLKPVINIAKQMGLEWKAVTDTVFEEKPSTWHCPVCNNTWKIPSQVYTEPVIEGKPIPQS